LPVDTFQEAVTRALGFLNTYPEALLTLGIKATFAHTGLGYLRRGKKTLQDGIYPVMAFKEKPNKSTARRYIRAGDYYWNSGMFFWRADRILQQLDRFLPHNTEKLNRIGLAWGTADMEKVLQEEFVTLENISIDFGVMERATDVYMCELDCHWLDVGSYESLAEAIGTADEADNVTDDKTSGMWIDSANNIVISDTHDHLIAAVHVENMIIVHTKDTTLICHRDETDQLKTLLEKMASNGLEKFS